MKFDLNRSSKDIIRENEKWFYFFVMFPEIVLGILGLFVFILGIANIINSGFIFGVLVWVIGAVLTAVIYMITKISLSHRVLSIYYLKEIANKSNIEKD